ncbi:MAG: SulP family inorganic anion transporter, partial [Proteobacteria bacterium]|nr:SulP family inorganic anion transporter [Pseudomonadota bacterium]
LGTFLSGGHVMINGPAAGLIVVVLTSVQELGKGNNELGFKLTLAAIVCAGIIQILLGLLRLGKFGLAAPANVIHGMLASIGVTIITKQIYVLCGEKAQGNETFSQIIELPKAIPLANLAILSIGLITLALIVFLNTRKKGILRFLPAPLAAVLLGIFFDKILDFEHLHSVHLFHRLVEVSDKFLLHVPTQLSQSLIAPDWSAIGQPVFWKMVFSLCFVASIESVLSSFAVDKMDPEQRRSNFNYDLISKGICNIVLGLIGGLPIITEIVRSSVNVGNGARTKWANFAHGLFILLFILFAPSVLNLIPLVSFAAVLIVVGFRLAHPHQLTHAKEIGWDQLALFLTTLLISLKTDLLVGVVSGILLKIVFNTARAKSWLTLFQLQVAQEASSGKRMISVKGPLVFTNILKLKTLLDESTDFHVSVDLRECPLIDHTAQDLLENEKRYFTSDSRALEILFSPEHQSKGHQPLSVKVLNK